MREAFRAVWANAYVKVGVGLLVAYLSIRVFVHLLTPLIMSKSTRLHPVTAILAVIGGFAVGGLVTAIFAVPLVAFAKALFVDRSQTSGYCRRG